MQLETSRYCVALIATLGAFGLMAGCAGSGDGLNNSGQPLASSSSSSSGAVTADFQSIQDNVFTPICSKCHIGASAPEGLQLDAAHSYNLLVGVPSVEQGNLLRVLPGDPDDSYMVRKIEGLAGIDGGQMPLGETPLPQATITAIRQWITNGAMNVQAASLAAAISRAAGDDFAVQSTAPLDQASVPAPLRQVVVTFTHDLDASLVNTTTVTLERIVAAQPAAESAVTDSAPLVPIGVALAAHNPQVILITPSAALAAGSYRVTLRGSGGGALADVDAQALAGDTSFAFSVEAAP